MASMMLVAVALAAVALLVVMILTSKRPYAATALCVSAGLALDAVLPTTARIALLAGVACLAAYALAALSSSWRSVRPAQRWAVLSTAAVCVWWILQLANPNVLSFASAFEGLRKSVMLFLGLWIGMVVADHIGSRRTVKILTWMLGGSLVLALLIRHLAPDLEQLVNRSANIATATLGGEYRLAGLFAGPFHVGLGASTAIALAVVSYLVKAAPLKSNLLLSSTGVAALLASEVRTAYVAALVAVIVGVIACMTLGARLSRVAVAVSLISVVAYNAIRDSATVSTILEAKTDTRLLSRQDSYEAGLSLLSERVWFGYGTGSASDIADRVGFGTAIVSHNVLLKFAFEGGVIGLALFVVAAVGLWRATRVEDGFLRGSARASLTAMATMGLTGSMVEALPVTVWLLMIVGAASAQAEREPHARPDAAVSRLRQGNTGGRSNARWSPARRV